MNTKRRPTIEFVTSHDLAGNRGQLRETRDFWSTGDLQRPGGDVPVARPPSDSGSYAERGFSVVRIRARAWLLPCIEPPSSRHPGGQIEIPTRDELSIGEDIGVELSLGALADPIGLRGRVVERFERCRQSSAGRGPSILLRVEPEHAKRLNYVESVLEGSRKATSRRYQRVPTDLALTWFFGGQRHGARVANLSRGGAFLLANVKPEPGTRVTVMLPDGDEGAVGLTATVAWSPEVEPPRGFGVAFRFTDREQAQVVDRVVKHHQELLSV